jgi:hypothetical protein
MANRTNRTPWTKEAAQELFRLLADGLSDRQIAERMSRTLWAVSNRRRRAGLPGNRNPRPKRRGKVTLWTPEEDATLKDMHANGASDDDISERLGRSANACRIRRNMLGIVDTSRSSTAPVSPIGAKQRQLVENKRPQGDDRTDREQRIANARATNDLRRQEAFRRQFGRQPAY